MNNEFNRMSLMKYMMMHPDEDFDTTDYAFDMTVTCCCVYPEDIEESSDYYDKVTLKLYELVEVVDETKYKIGSTWFHTPICDWSGLIKRNYDLFYNFAKKHFNIFKDDIDKDKLTEKWIHDIHYYLAGYTTERIYEEFYRDVLEKCESDADNTVTEKEYSYQVGFGSEHSPSSMGWLSVKAISYEEAYNKACEYVGTKLYESFPELDVEYYIYMDDVK